MRRVLSVAAATAVSASLLAWGAASSVAAPESGRPSQAGTSLSETRSSAPAATAKEVTFGFVGRASVAMDPGQESDAEVATISGDSLFVIDRVLDGDTVKPGVRRFDIKNPASPKSGMRIDLSKYGADVNSVAAHGKYVVAALQAEPKTKPGRIVIMTWNGKRLVVAASVKAGALPDMVAFSLDGKHVLAANEGEPDGYGPGFNDPEGSLTWVDIAGAVKGSNKAVKQIRFTSFNAKKAALRKAGVRIFGPDATVAQDLEPEYVTFDPANPSRAWVSLQENNALGVINLSKGSVTAIKALGTKNHSVKGMGMDASDKDDRVNIRTWPVRGMYMPDGIASFVVKGKTYVVSANEGDAREYDGLVEEVRVGDDEYPLNPAIFPNAAELKKDENLGRLTVTTEGVKKTGSTYDEILSFGGRSLSIWDANGKRVWDSGDSLESMTGARLPRYFNSTNDEVEFDNRSDNKGPEPEGVAVGVINGRTYAFAAIERIGGLAVFDVTNPAKGRLIQYLNTRNFLEDAAPDSGAETVSFVSAKASPNGKPLVAVSNEVTGTVTMWQPVNPDGAANLTLLHNNDGESSLFVDENTVGDVALPVGSAPAFSSVAQRELSEARKLGNSVVTVYAGDSFLASTLLSCSLPPNPASTPVYDGLAQRFMPYDVHVFGNHEFDFGPDFLKRYVDTFNNGTSADQPFISGNLDFEPAAEWKSAIKGDGVVAAGNIVDGKVVGEAAIVSDIVSGQRFGIVSATTWMLETISSPAPVVLTTDDLQTTANKVQAQVDAFTAMGVTKVIFVSHLQDIDFDKQLLAKLRNVDIAVAGGGDDILADDTSTLLPGSPAPVGTYPLNITDAAGVTVPLVTAEGQYKYVGRLDAQFNSKGELAGVDKTRSYARRVIPASSAATTLGLTDVVEPDELVATVIEPAQECIDGLKTPVIGTEVQVNVSKTGNESLGFARGVRSGETNGGNLVTDGLIQSYDLNAARVGLPARSSSNLVAAIQNGGGIRQNNGDILPVGGGVPGTISRDNTLNVLPFLTNLVVVVPDLNPSEMKTVFERSLASGGAPECADAGGGQFLQVAQLRVIADCTKTAQVVTSEGAITTPGERVQYLAFDPGTPANLADDVVLVENGAVVLGAPTVSLVTNSFTAAGGDNYPTLKGKSKINIGATAEAAFYEYLLSFPKSSAISNLPTIPASNPAYASPTGEGRITYAG